MTAERAERAPARPKRRRKAATDEPAMPLSLGSDADELQHRVRSLEAERLRPVPKAFTSRAHDDAFNVLIRGLVDTDVQNGSVVIHRPVEDRLTPDDESGAAAKRLKELAQALADDDQEE